jgi:hypothetical protein
VRSFITVLIAGILIMKKTRRWVVHVVFKGRKEAPTERQDWIDLAWDRELWRALVNMVMNLWVP